MTNAEREVGVSQEGRGSREDRGERGSQDDPGGLEGEASGRGRECTSDRDRRPAQSDRSAQPDRGVSPDEVRRATVEPVSDVVTPDEEARARELIRRRGGYTFPQFFSILNLGLVLNAVSLVLFKTPNHLAFGGTSGLAILLGTALPVLPVSVWMWALNVVLVVLGFVFLDRRTILWTAYASLALSAYTSLLEWALPVASSVTGDLWLDLCFAVLLPAIGSAMIFDIGASTGGTDIAAMILRKHTDIEIGKALLAVDLGIVAAAVAVYGPRVGLYCVLGLLMKSFMMDGFIESIRQRKVCQVICARPREVEEFIVKKLGRTATVTFGWGAYSGRRVIILTSVLSRREAMKLRLFVRATDPGAFITITSSSEIVGRGFRGVN